MAVRYLGRKHLATGEVVTLIRVTRDEDSVRDGVRYERFDVPSAGWVEDPALVYVTGIGGAADVDDLNRRQARRWLTDRKFDGSLLLAPAT